MEPPNQQDVMYADWDFTTAFNATEYESEQPPNPVTREEFNDLTAEVHRLAAEVNYLTKTLARVQKYIDDLGPFLAQMRNCIKDALIVENPTWDIRSPTPAQESERATDRGEGGT
ncbi:MAG: hypothetical protein Q9214_006102 [Letrouitia sp. 1 TL-2023]